MYEVFAWWIFTFQDHFLTQNILNIFRAGTDFSNLTALQLKQLYSIIRSRSKQFWGLLNLVFQHFVTLFPHFSRLKKNHTLYFWDFLLLTDIKKETLNEWCAQCLKTVHSCMRFVSKAISNCVSLCTVFTCYVQGCGCTQGARDTKLRPLRKQEKSLFTNKKVNS